MRKQFLSLPRHVAFTHYTARSRQGRFALWAVARVGVEGNYRRGPSEPPTSSILSAAFTLTKGTVYHHRWNGPTAESGMATKVH